MNVASRRMSESDGRIISGTSRTLLQVVLRMATKGVLALELNLSQCNCLSILYALSNYPVHFSTVVSRCMMQALWTLPRGIGSSHSYSDT